MTLTKIIALGALSTGLTVAASADTFFHLKVDLGGWKIAVGSTSGPRYCDRPVYVPVRPVYVPEYRHEDWRRDDWRRDDRRDDRRDWRRDRGDDRGRRDDHDRR